MYCFVFCRMFYFVLFFFKQKTAYEMRISDWSSDVCSSDLVGDPGQRTQQRRFARAIGANDRGELAGRERRAHPLDQRLAASMDGEAVEDQRVSHGPSVRVAARSS